MSRDTGRAAAGRAGSFNSGKNVTVLPVVEVRGDAPVAAHACVARRSPSAGRGRREQSCCARGTERAGLAAMATRRWWHTQGGQGGHKCTNPIHCPVRAASSTKLPGRRPGVNPRRGTGRQPPQGDRASTPSGGQGVNPRRGTDRQPQQGDGFGGRLPTPAPTVTMSPLRGLSGWEGCPATSVTRGGGGRQAEAPPDPPAAPGPWPGVGAATGRRRRRARR
jgi:hypothetical protein